MASAIELKLAALREGQEVTLVERAGARVSGSVVKRRPEDPERTVGVRRQGGTVSWIPFDRVREVE